MMFDQIQSPKIFSFENLVAQMAEIFEGLNSATYLKPENQTLYESLADPEFLTDWLINTLDEDFDFVMSSQLADVVDDEQANEKIKSYYQLIKQLNDSDSSLYSIALIHPDSLESYVRESLEMNEAVKQVAEYVDWASLTEAQAQNAEYIELNHPAIHFTGQWILK